VVIPVPTATLSANPTTIDEGQSSTLSWNSTDATSCVGTGFTAGPTSGSVSTGALNNSGIQNYQVICSGAGGNSTPAFASVLVLAPTASISAIPNRVNVGSSTVVSWATSGVTSCGVTRNNAAWLSNLTGPDLDSSATATNIITQTVFAINCLTNSSPVHASTTVNVTTSFLEF